MDFTIILFQIKFINTMKKFNQVLFILLLLAFSSVSFHSLAQDGPGKKKSAKSCHASCEGLSGLRKRSLQSSGTTTAKSSATAQVNSKAK